MVPTNGEAADAKALVQRGYDSCAEAYDLARRREGEPALSALSDRLPDGAAVLDIGCGAGIPVSRDLAQRFVVTGVDISGTMIGRARAHVPQGIFIQADIMSADFPPGHWDAVVAFYSIFHLRREEHEELFRRVYRWLKPGGYLMATVGMHDEPAYTEDFFGVTMYWSNYGLATYRAMLTRIGYRLLRVAMLGHGYGEGCQVGDERHPLVFAQKPSPSRID